MDEALTGEPLALDLLNTRPADGDLLSDVAGLRAWLRLQAGRGLPADPAEAGAAELAAARGVRALAAEAIGLARGGEPVPAEVLAGLNAALGAAPVVGELTGDGAELTYRQRRQGRPADRLAAELAGAVAELIADPVELAAIRECAAEDCVLLFRPANPRRQWCSAARCGNRARVARHYRRQKAAEA
ncbi:CGNR zinc finger domain-containing protein [Kitasatospora sp. NBC_00070]|uniref:CGNR zinc finger domain-containing protein n=1 Tax=Kitasatospora sp. NBC_00070 TaxID=2975962 RepID=UPI0032555AD8